MDTYSLVKPLLFALEPETSHHFALRALQLSRLASRVAEPPARRTPAEFAGLRFLNGIGLAAGVDKNACYIDALGSLGFGFMEVGTITPVAQAGRPRPRLFRLNANDALINRMGFPNEGVEAIARRIAQRSYKGVLGANIGVNATTPVDAFVEDFVRCFRRVSPLVDYVTVNVSSPNTAALRDMQSDSRLRSLLGALQDEREGEARSGRRRVPLLVKLSPDLTEGELRAAATTALESGVDGIIATNTTVQRPVVDGQAVARETGGLSGRPLLALALQKVAALRATIGDRALLIGVGGISCADDYSRMRDAGANLVQLYTGLVFRGPALIRELLQRDLA
jgi:dihydroorotate dehydrogenase